MNKSYVVARSNYKHEIVVINYSKINGYKVNPKNNIKNSNIKVNYLIIVKPSFKKNVLKRKIKIKLEYYLKYLVSISEDDDSDARKALNDLERFREIVEYKYREHLDDKYVNLLLKKLSSLERGIKTKLVYSQIKEEKSHINESYNEEIVETRRRNR